MGSPESKQIFVPNNQNPKFPTGNKMPKRFLLLNCEGHPLAKYYIQIETPPKGATPGNGFWSVGDRKVIINYTINSKTAKRLEEMKVDEELTAWHKSSPKKTFQIAPIFVESELCGLKMFCRNGNVCDFALQIMDFDWELRRTDSHNDSNTLARLESHFSV